MKPQLQSVVTLVLVSLMVALAGCGGGETTSATALKGAEGRVYASAEAVELTQAETAFFTVREAASNIVVRYIGAPFNRQYCIDAGFPATECVAGNVSATYTFSTSIIGPTFTGTFVPSAVVMRAAGFSIDSSIDTTLAYIGGFRFENGKLTAWNFQLIKRPAGAGNTISIFTAYPIYGGAFFDTFSASTANRVALGRGYSTSAGSMEQPVYPYDPEKNFGIGICDSFDDCKKPCNCEPSNLAGHPINTATGNKILAETDLAAEVNTGISLNRYYNSLDSKAGPFGFGWRTEWHRSIAIDVGLGTGRSYRQDGRAMQFKQDANGVWRPEADVTTSLLTLFSPQGQPQGWKLIRPNDDTELYSMDGRLMSVMTRTGRTTTLTYDANNQLSTVTGPFGHQMLFSYVGVKISQITAPDGGVYTYTLDTAGNLASVKFPDGALRRYVYENTNFPHALTGILDELGVRYSTYSYDTAGRATRTELAGGVDAVTVVYNADGTSTITDAFGFAHTTSFVTQFGMVKPTSLSGVAYPRAGGQSFTYDGNGFLASKRDWNGNLTTYSHDTSGNETSRTYAAGTTVARAITTEWSAAYHLPSKVTLPTKTVRFTRDDSGNLLARSESADGADTRVWTYTYTPLGQVATATDPNGNTSTLDYNKRGDLISIANALGHQTQIPMHDASGRPTQIIDPNGLITTFDYDARGRLITINAGGEITRYGYDLAGNLISFTRPDSSVLTLKYDAAHRLTRVTDSLGNYITYELDKNGNRKSIQFLDAQNLLARVVYYSYDSVNRISQIKTLHGSTNFLRDGNGNVLTITDPRGAVTQMLYDALDRKYQTTDANGGVTNQVFDVMERPLSVTDPRGLTTAYEYNGFGDLLKIQSPDSGTTLRTSDNAANLATSTDARGAQVVYGYDALNRLTHISFDTGGHLYEYDQGTYGKGHLTRASGPGNALHLTYDQHGRLTSRQQAMAAGTWTQSFVYNAVGQLTRMIYPSSTQLNYQYDAAGQVSNLAVNSLNFLTAIKHEPFGPMKAWTWGTQNYVRSHDFDGNVSTFLLGNVTRTLTYDAALNISAMRDSNGTQQSFTYDPLSRLERYTSGATSQLYDYDLDGNRTSLTSGSIVTAYGISPDSNQLLSQTNPDAANLYNAAGSLIHSGALNLSYDALGRMTGSLMGTARTNRTLYTTNALGRRIQKSGPTGTTSFLYGDESQLVGEYGPSVTQETIYLEGQPVGLLHNSQLMRIYADQINTPRAITNTAGTTMWSWGDEPFGNRAPTGTITFNQRFPGQYFDAETGLHYNMARYYDPKIGRYVQSDPIGLKAGNNTYVYSLNSPINYADPFGLESNGFWERWKDAYDRAEQSQISEALGSGYDVLESIKQYIDLSAFFSTADGMIAATSASEGLRCTAADLYFREIVWPIYASLVAAKYIPNATAATIYTPISYLTNPPPKRKPLETVNPAISQQEFEQWLYGRR